MKTLSRVAPLMFACLIASPAVAGDRDYWRHAQGHFENVIGPQGNVWIERGPGGQFQFVESDRTLDYVELYDQSRDCTVRLTANSCLVKAPFTGNQFVLYYHGRWGSE
jgi:hypothetical protein